MLIPAGESTETVLASVRPAVPRATAVRVANMAMTVDGSVALDGRSAEISAAAPGDRALFRALRDQADAVLAGTATLAAEPYRRLIATEERRADRVARGLQPDALAVVLTRSGELPTQSALYAEPDQPRVEFTGDAAAPAHALAALRAEHGVEVLLCEGGPHLLGELTRAGLVDELWVTISPLLAGGAPELSLLAGAMAAPRALELRSLLEFGGGLHARYAMLDTRPPMPPGTPPGALPPQ